MDTKRRDKALQMAVMSDNPAVQQALEHLLVMMEMAHSEEITEALKPHCKTHFRVLKNRQTMGTEQNVRLRRDGPEWFWKGAAD